MSFFGGKGKGRRPLPPGAGNSRGWSGIGGSRSGQESQSALALAAENARLKRQLERASAGADKRPSEQPAEVPVPTPLRRLQENTKKLEEPKVEQKKSGASVVKKRDALSEGVGS